MSRIRATIVTVSAEAVGAVITGASGHVFAGKGSWPVAVKDKLKTWL